VLPDPETSVFQSYDEITGSLSDASLENIYTGSLNDYPNLNTDFSKFENHTFFGSAKRKLENFKIKVQTIQNYYSDISSSLIATSSINMENDADAVVKYRQKLFEKINDEIKTFTPYEKFLYYDGQNESSASAPGLGQLYTSTYAINDSKQSIDKKSKFFRTKNGLPRVYKITGSVDKVENDIPLNIFKDKYRAELKPFYNYSGSVYLSFLVKGDKNLTESTGSDNTPHSFRHNYSEPRFDGLETPQDSLYKRFIESSSLTSSEYRRNIIHSSASYWMPTDDVGYDVGSISDWGAGSTEIEILSGSIKTGSHAIIASGDYEHLATYVLPSGSNSYYPFIGSIMPSGDLFNVYLENPNIKNLSGSYSVDGQTSGSVITNAMLTDISGRENTGSIDEGTPTVSDGVEAHGRQYGQSMFFLSESNDSIRFFSDDNFNFTRDDNFSLSIWAKRFHSNTGSADSTKPSSANVQPIFTRGQTGNSYGIDYDFHNNLIRAGVRGDSVQEQVTFTAEDDLLEWNHIAFTYESGSETGIKLYVNGELKNSTTTTGATYSITASSHFSASAENIGSSADALSIAGNDVIGGSSGHFNGFLQYPRVYDKAITQDEVQRLYLNPDGVLEAEITDVKVSLENPKDVLPFDILYHTSSTNWTTWYDGLYDSASAFDDDNIHSLENNLPTYIKNSSQYGDLKQFLGVQGEQFDLIRNHIDGYLTLYNRNYKSKESVPDNLLPILLENFGWEAINPFTASLADYFGDSLSSVTSIQDIEENTWRKTLNNLIYLYKTKGTKNSVRSLLNIYGYPPDIIEINEFGGTTELQIGSDIDLVSDATPSQGTTNEDTNFKNQKGNVSYILKKKKLHHYRFDGKSERVLNFDWWMNGADANTIQFVYKHAETTQTQNLVKSSGSGEESLWDLRLVPSADGISSSFEFRLNNSNTGSLNLSGSAVSMSTDYNNMINGQLWNVMLQRMSSSISASGINEYRLVTSLQDESKISKLSFVSMSISGGLSNTYITGGAFTDGNYYANQNWQVSGSRHYQSSSNLFVGELLTGSISEFRTWTTPLSMSKFRLHTLNKFSTVGNTISSHKDELIYHFRLNESHFSSSVSSSATIDIVDSNPKGPINNSTDYTFTKNSNIATASLLYGFDRIDTNTISFQDSDKNQINSNMVLVDPDVRYTTDLNPFKPVVKSLEDKRNIRGRYNNSSKLEINRSPQDYINNFIMDKIQGFNLETLYGDPGNRYSASYAELDSFREEFYDQYGISVDINKFIKAHENLFNPAVVDGLNKLVPARTNLGEDGEGVGVTIKPTVLEKPKVEHNRNSIEVNPNLATGSISINNLIIKEASNELSKNAFISINDVIVETGSHQKTKDASININNLIAMNESSFESPKSGSISMLSNPIRISGSENSLDDGVIKIEDSYEPSKDSSISIDDLIVKESFHDETKNSTISIDDVIVKEFSYESEKDLSLNITESIVLNSSKQLPYSSSIPIAIEHRDFTGTGSSDINNAVIKFHQTTIEPRNMNLHITQSIVLNSSKQLPYSSSISPLPSTTGSTVVYPISGTNNYISTNYTKKFVNLHDSWGTSSSDVHFPNYGVEPHDTGSRAFENVNHIETRYHFHMIGDTEVYSGSIRGVETTDFSNYSKLLNRQMIDVGVHKNIEYHSYINGNPGPIKGRMIGKTRYFYTGSDGTIVLPSNHVRRFSNPFVDRMYEGTQNTNPGIMNTVDNKDLSTASYYRITTTGENILKVQRKGD